MQCMILIYEPEDACEGEAGQAALEAALALAPAPAERAYLQRRLDTLAHARPSHGPLGLE